MEHTHMAVGETDGFAYRVDIHWTPRVSRVEVTVRTAADLREHGTYGGIRAEPMPAGTVGDTFLDVLAAQILGPFKVITADWVVDPVSLAGEYVKNIGFQWVPEKLAKKSDEPKGGK
ncbi:hypothetical protein J7I97_16880 [Streptomyces sp. ISL-87]|uniref:hypothetical protein n=1 Tax=Streptomyces sp. ISL-87 TaxID=2819188 RepID=UPI001BE6C44F|nr:hypothetical protein [Streptomyces sp. ISL-87]MBT2609902.1 hypothetical protein [Streptomyces sp. ISL-87]